MGTVGFFRVLLVFCMCEGGLQDFRLEGMQPFIREHEQRVSYGDTGKLSPSLKPKRFEMKIGSTINLNCNKFGNDIIWQYKHCSPYFEGVDCEKYLVESRDNRFWKLLKTVEIKVYTIKNASLEDRGIYRCISRNLVRRIFIVEIENEALSEWPPPKVISVIPSAFTTSVNSFITFNCTVFSKSPPKIIWFKECWIPSCEIDYSSNDILIEDSHNNCLCLLNETGNNSIYNWKNLYISKFHIFNAQVWDGGTYFCSVISADGKDYKSASVEVRDYPITISGVNRKSYLVLLFIPLVLILLYITSHFCCAKNRRKLEDTKQLNNLIRKTQLISNK